MQKVLNALSNRYDQIMMRAQTLFEQLQPRDRIALIILSLFLTVTMVGGGLWLSYQAAFQQQQRLTDLKDNLTWMQSKAVQFSTQSAEGSSVTEKAQRLAQQMGFSIQLQEQQDQTKVIASHANYAVLANYLTQLAQQGVSISQLNMQKQTTGEIQLNMLIS